MYFIQTVFREDIWRYYDIIMYFYSDSMQRGFRPRAEHTPALLRMEYAFEACVTQTHLVTGFLVLYHRKLLSTVDLPGNMVALLTKNLSRNGYVLCSPFQASHYVVPSSNLSNVSLHIRLAAVQVAQGLVLAPNILNPLDA